MEAHDSTPPLPPHPIQWTLIRHGALLAGGCILIGFGTALGLTPGGLVGGLLLGVGGLLALISGARLWQNWQALDRLVDRLSRAPDATLLQRDPALPAGSPLAPLADRIAQLGVSVRQLMMQLQMESDQVRNIALRIGEAAARHNQSAGNQATAIDQVAVAVSELETLITQVTQTVHEVALAADQVRSASTSSHEVVDEAITAIQGTRQRVEETVTALDALRDRANRIGAISDVIAQIAEHTHVLALNAAIEAAGAGEAGRRFSVVAGEIRTLAAQAREEGQRVQQLVQELDQAMRTTMVAARTGLHQTEKMTALTTTLTVTTTQLTTTAQHTQHLARAIDQAMVQQRLSAGEVARALTTIAETAQGMRAETTVTNTEAADLIEVAQHLHSSALRFGLGRAAAPALRLLIAGRETVSERGLAWRALVEAWNNAHPATTVAIEFIPPSDDYEPALVRAFIAGTAPDIIQVVNGPALAAAGHLSPLDALLSPAVLEDFYAPALEVARYQGQLYSLPTEAQPLILLYNQRLFAELELAVPRTWEEWLLAGQRCRTAERWGLIMETTPGELRAKQWLPFIWQGGAELCDSTGQVHPGTPAVQAALGLWHDLLVTHSIAPRKPPHPFYDIANLAEGHCAMQYIGAWGLNMLRESYPGFAAGIMDLPLPPGGRPATLLLRWGLGVNAHSPRREAALGFVQWALAADGPAGAARTRALMVEGLPVRRSVVPLVEAEGPLDPAWRFMLEQIYPHARPTAEWSATTAEAADQLLEDTLRAPTPLLA
jgi:methyl-accepting chemotaxis protein/ABC-type glycerol-3-phosphate transport system substrate-binding protein